MASKASVNYSLEQEGWGRVSDSTFQTTGATNRFSLVSGTSTGVGWAFNWSLSTSTGDGISSSEALVLDPPLIDLLTISYVLFSTTAVTGDAVISFVPEATPALYSDSLLPGSRSEIEIYRETRTTLANVNTTLLLRPFGTATTPMDGGAAYRDISALDPYLKADDWNGRLCLTLTWEADTGTPFYVAAAGGGGATLTSREEAFHTGHWIPEGTGRARMDDRLGMFVGSKELVADGRLVGLDVLPDDWDPDEDVDRWVPPKRESVVDPE